MAILVTSYCLNRHDRVSSLCWTRGSKLCFFTCFSNFSRYFLILVFLQKRYLLISLPLSWLHGNTISCPISCTFGTPSWYVVQSFMCPHISGAEPTGFLKQDACGNLLVDSLPVIFPLSAFCRRFLMQTSIGQTRIIPFLLTKILKLAAKLHSTAWVRNPQGISKLVNKVDCWVPCALLKAIVRAFLATKSFTAGSSMYPCHMAYVSKSVLRDIISLSGCCPQWHRSTVDVRTIVGANHSESLSCIFQGQVRKVVLLWYCFCMWLPSRNGT